MKIMFVANKKLPASDYRVQYGLQTTRNLVSFGLPARPDNVPEDRYVPLGFGEGLRLADLRALACLWLRLRRDRVDYVHFSATVPILLGPYVAFLAGTRCLVTLTGFGRTFTSERLRYRILRPLYWLLLGGVVRLTDRVLLQNSGDLAALRDRYPVFASKFTLIGSGVAGQAQPVDRQQVSALHVLLVARLLPDKGVLDFLKVASRLRGRGFRFVLVGPTARGGEDTLRAVQRAVDAGEVEYRGEAHGTKLAAEYARAEVLLFPSVGEGMPRVMLEAGFAGICPVAYDIPANRDLVHPGGGMLVASGDEQGLTTAIEQLAADRQALRSNAHRYQQHIMARYSMEAFTSRMDSLLDSLNHQTPRENSITCLEEPDHCVSRIRDADIRDLDAIVAIHQVAFPGFFLTRLGHRFLSAYYRMILRDPTGVLLVGETRGSITGFAAGVLEPERFYRRMRRNVMGLGVPIVFRLLTHPPLLPAVAARVWRLIRGGHPQGRTSSGTGTLGDPTAELTSLAVLPSQRRHGQGRDLMLTFIVAARHRGVSLLRLTTDALANEAAHAFYTRLGFSRSDQTLGTCTRPLTEYTLAVNEIPPRTLGHGRPAAAA